MRVSVFGLGYVGAVSCGCFARDGLSVVGVDANPAKVEMLLAGRAPVIEAEIDDIIREGVDAGRLRATTSAAEAVQQTDVSVVSVGTPSQANGSLDLTAVGRVAEQIGSALAGKSGRHLVVVRSTVLPGTVRGLIVPALERHSGKRAGDDFGVCFNPEFMREGSSVRDHYAPPFVLVGADRQDDGAAALRLYERSSGERFVTGLETAEMVKYVCNAFHALKITFANEVGILSQASGVDSHEVMRLVCADTKLNISPRYLTPGFAFGGSCLPKDLRAMLYRAREADLELPLLQAVLPSNREQVERAAALVLGLKRRRIAMLGLSFKAGTDDLRESPLVSLTETLIGKGCDLRIYDSNVALSRLTGANREYIEREIPHISSLMVETLDEAVDHAEVIVVGNAARELPDLPRLCRPGQAVVDLVRFDGLADLEGIAYHGIAW